MREAGEAGSGMAPARHAFCNHGGNPGPRALAARFNERGNDHQKKGQAPPSKLLQDLPSPSVLYFAVPDLPGLAGALVSAGEGTAGAAPCFAAAFCATWLKIAFKSPRIFSTVALTSCDGGVGMGVGLFMQSLYHPVKSPLTHTALAFATAEQLPRRQGGGGGGGRRLPSHPRWVGVLVHMVASGRMDRILPRVGIANAAIL